MNAQSLDAAVVGLEIAMVHAEGAVDFYGVYDPEARGFRLVIHHGDHTVADVETSRLFDALIRAEQAVHDNDRTAVTA